jgi:glycosyltransferase involved in cell wall biosynthesis
MTDFEVLAVDDGSTDATSQILRRYADVDTRLRILTLAHHGRVTALNAGIMAAKTDFIVRIDADDLMAPNRLERQLAYMDANPRLGGAGSYYFIIDEHGKVQGSQEAPTTSLARLNHFIDNGGDPIFPHPTMIFRTSVVVALGNYREEFPDAEDVDLFIRLIEAGYPVLTQPEYLTYFRYHSSSVSARTARAQFESNEYIYGNFWRRRSGGNGITLDQYNSDLAHMSLPRKLAREGRYLARVLLRRRDMAKLKRQHVTATLFLVGAAVCNPGATFRKIRRYLT